MIKKSIFLVFLFLFSIVKAQETVTNIDSLLVALQQAKEDTSKVNLYQKIASHYNVTHLDSAKTFAENGGLLAKKLNDSVGLWKNLNVLANYYERKTAYDSAFTYYNKALEVIKSTNNTKGFAVVLNNIATVYIRKGEYDTALTYMFEALKAEERLGNKNGIAQAYNNIGVIYYYTQEFDKTTYYLTEALKIQESLGNYDGLINGYNNVGAILDYQKKYDEAIVSYQKGLEISRKIKDKKMEAIQLSNIAVAYSKKKDFQQADDYFQQAIALKLSIQDENGLATSYAAYGESLMTQNEYKRAEDVLEKGLELSKEHGIKLVKREIYHTLSKLEANQNNYQASNNYLKEYIAVKDSILNENNAKIIADVETKYETEKKEKELLLQKALVAEKELQVKQKNYLIFGSLGLAIVFGMLGYLLFSQQRLKNRQLQKENELKDALLKIETQNKLQEQRLRISRDLHDNIGSQLTFIISSIDNLKYGFKDLSEGLTNKLSGISSFTTQTIYELRDTIWAMNKNEISFEDLESRIHNFIDNAKVAAFAITYSFTIEDSVNLKKTFSSVQGMNLYRMIQETVHNAIKYADTSKIAIIISEKDHLVITIKDFGKGFNIETVSFGNGINNLKKRAKELQADLNIDSVDGEGTTISITLPKS